MSTRASSAQSSAYDNTGNHCTYSSSSARPKASRDSGRNSKVQHSAVRAGKTTPHHTATQATYPSRTLFASPDQPASFKPERYFPNTATSSSANLEGGHSERIALVVTNA